MSTEKIQSALEKSFARQRVVFWYDEDAEWWPEFDSVFLADVEKITVTNNEFAVKHRIAREMPRRKFLLYFRGKRQPEDTANWLLDQLLANGPAFSPDRASLALIDAGLPPEFKPLTARHLEFFGSADRLARLKEWQTPDDTERSLRLKMVAVICKTEPAVENVLLALLSDMAREKGDRWKQIEKYDLAEMWWQELSDHFGYLASAPTMLDFVLSLFRAAAPVGGTSNLDTRQSLVFFNRWKDSQEYRDTFSMMSDRAAQMLNVSATLNQIEDARPLFENDTYRLIDLRILADLRNALVHGALSPDEIRQRAEKRERLYWARHDTGIQSLYRAIAMAAEFVEALPKLDLSIESFDAGLEKYATTWWRVDQIYRKFIFHYAESGQTALLEQLAERIEGLYANEYLGKLSHRWQEWVDRRVGWPGGAAHDQRDFFTRFVQPQISDGRKVFVIVSDALRYEAGCELLERILAQDRWKAEIKPMLAALPSFTQVGMAALLPHASLEFSGDGQTILADKVSTGGTEARAQILANRLSGRGTALRAEQFLALNSKTDGREISRANDVVYIYHNAIDAIGDKRDTEHRTCAAVEAAIEDLVRILKKAAAMNVSSMIVTADHGFLYQHEPMVESDFLGVEEPTGTLKYDRRFIVATSSSADARLKHFTAGELGFANPVHLFFPKGTLRMRLQGSGSRYVHGGTSLQEIVIPVIEVKKERASDVAAVDVDIVRTGQQITTGQVTVTFVQSEPVGEKSLARELRAAFFSSTDVQISDAKILKLDASAEDARLRERRERFIFSREANRFNQQDVVLRLEEQIQGTTQYAPYKEFPFRLRRTFESDFDEL